MADMAERRVKREDIRAMVEDARDKRKNRANHVRSLVESQYPELVGKQVKRGAQMYDAIDYIIDDLESYG